MRINWNLTLFIFCIVAFSCADTKTGSDEKLQEFLGSWSAEWATDPASFPDVQNISSFTMNGKLIFYPDSVEINAYGFEGCIFSNDTLRHALQWKISNDTLSLINASDPYGMSYTIKEISSDMIKLQLMDDISLTLKK
ncbi:MAG: hypothetical protein O2887_04185 [Bacteroidetes bacterium]|nr:hypothetical protein [Bacteroidota bacterium]